MLKISSGGEKEKEDIQKHKKAIFSFSFMINEQNSVIFFAKAIADILTFQAKLFQRLNDCPLVQRLCEDRE